MSVKAGPGVARNKRRRNGVDSPENCKISFYNDRDENCAYTNLYLKGCAY